MKEKELENNKSSQLDEDSNPTATNVAETPAAGEEAPGATSSAPEGEPQEEETGPVTLSREAWSELLEKAAKADENWERLVRERAELENYKKRAARERSESVRYANEALIESLLPILDNFEMAMMALGQAGATNIDTVKVGVEMIQSQLKRALEEVGLEEIDARGHIFDPNTHEALSQEGSSEVDEGSVISQSRKGYRLKDRLIRPASVVVSKGPESEGAAAEGPSESENQE